MASEFEAEIRNSMRSLQSAIEGVGRAQVKTTAEVARFGQVASAGVQEAEERGRAARGGGEEAGQDLARARPRDRQGRRPAGRAGGEVRRRRSAWKAGCRASRSPRPGRRGAEGVSAVLNKQTQDAKDAADAWKKMSDAIEGAQEKGNAASLAGVGQAVGRRKVRAIGGAGGIAELDDLTQNGGIGEDEATAGLASIYGRFGRTNQAIAAISTAKALAQTGVPFSHAASELAKGGADLSLPGVARQTAGRVFNDYYGAVQGGEANFNQALRTPAATSTCAAPRACRASRARPRRCAAARSPPVTPKASRGASSAAAKNPAAAAVIKVFDAYQKEAALLAKVAELQSYIAGNFQDHGRDVRRRRLGGEPGWARTTRSRRAPRTSSRTRAEAEMATIGPYTVLTFDGGCSRRPRRSRCSNRRRASTASAWSRAAGRTGRRRCAPSPRHVGAAGRRDAVEPTARCTARWSTSPTSSASPGPTSPSWASDRRASDVRLLLDLAGRGALDAAAGHTTRPRGLMVAPEQRAVPIVLVQTARLAAGADSGWTTQRYVRAVSVAARDRTRRSASSRWCRTSAS
jgi:hypothetical protein